MQIFTNIILNGLTQLQMSMLLIKNDCWQKCRITLPRQKGAPNARNADGKSSEKRMWMEIWTTYKLPRSIDISFHVLGSYIEESLSSSEKIVESRKKRGKKKKFTSQMERWWRCTLLTFLYQHVNIWLLTSVYKFQFTYQKVKINIKTLRILQIELIYMYLLVLTNISIHVYLYYQPQTKGYWAWSILHFIIHMHGVWLSFINSSLCKNLNVATAWGVCTSSFWTNPFQHIHLFSGMGIEVQM